MKKLYFKALTIVACVFIAGQALASDFTLNIHHEGKAASKQYCYTDFEIDLDGNWTARSMYSNGQQIDSGRFYSVITVKTKDGRSYFHTTEPLRSRFRWRSCKRRKLQKVACFLKRS